MLRMPKEKVRSTSITISWIQGYDIHDMIYMIHIHIKVTMLRYQDTRFDTERRPQEVMKFENRNVCFFAMILL